MSYEVAVDWDLPEGGVLTGVWSISSIYPETEAGTGGLGHRDGARPEFGRRGAQALARPRPRIPRGLVEGLLGQVDGRAFPTPSSRSSGISRPTSSGPLRAAARRRSPSRPSGRPTTAACRRGRATSTTTSTPSSATGRATAATGSRRGWPSSTGSGRSSRGARSTPSATSGSKGSTSPAWPTLDGAPMGGWIQYSLGPTVSAWLAHHFWLHWRYSGDRAFLEERAYPYLKAVAVFLDNISERRRGREKEAAAELEPRDQRQPHRRLVPGDDELRPGPHPLALRGGGRHGRRARAWPKKAERWRTILGEWPDLALAEDDGRLLVAPGYPLKESHRHFSHLMAIHPLGLVDRSRGEADQRTIRGALAELDRLGPDWWCGYSYSWLGNMAARAGRRRARPRQRCGPSPNASACPTASTPTATRRRAASRR